VRWILFVYFVLSGVTWVAGQAGRGVAGRLALPDLFLPVLVIGLIATQRTALRLPRLGVAAMFMLLSFAPGVMLAPQLPAALLEWAIYIYATLGFFIIYNLVVRMPLERRIETMVWWSRAAALLAAVGIYDFVALTVGIPRVSDLLGRSMRASSGLVGTFRNTGQAGSFFVTALAVALPLGTILHDRRRKNELTIISGILVLALVLSVKRAALLALLVGGTLFILRGLRRREAGRTLAVVAVSVLLLVPTYRWFTTASAAFRWRISNKLSSGATETVSRFAASNFEATREAFTAQPVVGVGLGTIAASGEEFEIHSTFLNVIASGGMVGIVGYIVMVLALFRTVGRPLNDDPRSRRFAKMFLPMLLGLIISYGYTNHLRKREFWITAALVAGLLAPEVVRRGRPAPVYRDPGEDPFPAPRPALAGAGPPGG
jgi:hypothetical protein